AKWTYKPDPDPASQGEACCDIVNRGASYGGGKIVVNTLDNHTITLHANPGRVVWSAKMGDIILGETTTMAPLIIGDKVVTGISGAEMGVRGRMAALDLATGNEVWKAYSTGSDQDVRIGPAFKAFYPGDRAKDLGLSTWTPDQWKIGGGNRLGRASTGRSAAARHGGGCRPIRDCISSTTVPPIPACGTPTCVRATTSGR